VAERGGLVQPPGGGGDEEGRHIISRLGLPKRRLRAMDLGLRT